MIYPKSIDQLYLQRGEYLLVSDQSITVTLVIDYENRSFTVTPKGMISAELQQPYEEFLSEINELVDDLLSRKHRQNMIPKEKKLD
jgi:hypothetical protein